MKVALRIVELAATNPAGLDPVYSATLREMNTVGEESPAEIVSRLRKSHGLSFQEAANELGIAVDVLRSIEAGDIYPSMMVLLAMTLRYGLSDETLLRLMACIVQHYAAVELSARNPRSKQPRKSDTP